MAFFDPFEFLEREAEGWDHFRVIVGFRDSGGWLDVPFSPDSSQLQKVLENNDEGEPLGFFRYNDAGSGEVFFQARVLGIYGNDLWAHRVMGGILDAIIEHLKGTGYEVDLACLQ